MPRLAVTIAAVGAAAAAVLVWGEVVHWRSSRRRLGGQPAPGPREAVVVLGYRNRTDRANLINRYRVGAGIRSQSRTSQSPASQRPTSQGVLVLSGGSVGGPIPEAEVMARYAREVLHFKGELVTETESRSTWENIRNVIPLIESADHVLIFSGDLGHFGGHADLAMLRKVADVKAIHPGVEIGWDGGANADNVAELAAGGIDVINVGGAIQRADDPQSAYDTLVSKISTT